MYYVWVQDNMLSLRERIHNDGQVEFNRSDVGRDVHDGVLGGREY